VNEEQERLAKQRALHMNLNTYLNVCVSANMLNRALSTIIAYRGRVRKSTLPHMSEGLITIDLYNILLHGYAAKGSFDRSQELFKLIEEDGLSFNEQSYAAIFECLGRLEPDEQNQQFIAKYIEQAEKEGFSLLTAIRRNVSFVECKSSGSSAKSTACATHRPHNNNTSVLRLRQRNCAFKFHPLSAVLSNAIPPNAGR